MLDRDLEFFEQLAALKREGQAFAYALVVSRRSPVSSHLGDRAIVFADGRMQGFVGGACSREIIRKQSLQAIQLGSPRLVQIRPEGAPNGFLPRDEHVIVPMSCASEGAVDVYIEPYPRPPLLLVVGYSPVAEALVRLGHNLEYEMVRIVTEEERRDLNQDVERVIALEQLPAYLAALPHDRHRSLMAIVASQGHYDEEALEALMGAQPLFLGLLASRKRGAQIRALLRDKGYAEAKVAAMRNPIGLDLGGKTPAEVAVSIVAEIIQLAPGIKSLARDVSAQEQSSQSPHATDPICGMTVEISSARHTLTRGGMTYYFCCPGCKAAYEKDIGQILTQAVAG